MRKQWALTIITPTLSLRRWLWRPQQPESTSCHRIGAQPAILAGLDEFREHLGGRLTIMLLRAIGVPFDAHEIDKGVMLGSVEVLRSFAETHQGKDSDGQRTISAHSPGSR